MTRPKGDLLRLCGSREVGKGPEVESGMIRYGFIGWQWCNVEARDSGGKQRNQGADACLSR